MASYDKGDVVRISATFRDIDGSVVDPSIVKFTWVKQGESATTVQYGGPDEKIKRQSAGVFYIDFFCDAGGRYGYQWTGDGTATAAAEGGFVVRDDVVFSN